MPTPFGSQSSSLRARWRSEHGGTGETGEPPDLAEVPDRTKPSAAARPSSGAGTRRRFTRRALVPPAWCVGLLGAVPLEALAILPALAIAASRVETLLRLRFRPRATSGAPRGS